MRGYSDDSPLVEMRMKAKEGDRQYRAEKRAGNGNRSMQVEDDPWVGSDISVENNFSHLTLTIFL